MFVVAGVSGNTGKVVADTLLSQGQKVRVIVRTAEKGEPWRARGAEVAIAKLEDEAALAKALAGARGAYLLLPPDYASNDNIGEKALLTKTLAAAIRTAKVPHVVFLSSIAAQHEKGTGPIRSVHHAEVELGKLTETRFTFLRPAYFMENVGSVLAPAREHGVLPATFDPKTRIPMIATKDIGRAAAKALVEGPAEGRAAIVELAGPREVSFDDVAVELTKLLGRDVKTVHVPPEGVAAALMQAGLTADLAGLYAEMSAAIDQGIMVHEGNGARFARGETEVGSVLRHMLGA